MFKQIAREPRLSDKVARQILEVIVNTPLRPGESLPSERQLGAEFGVSRTVIREAIRSLAGKGVLDLTQGRGLRVARVDPSSVHESMRLFLSGRPALDYARVHEVRALLETEVAGLAAQRASEADLRAMAVACEQLARPPVNAAAASEADLAFHRALARATHNELFLVLLDSIDAPLLEIRIETFEAVPHRAEIALEAHRSIVSAVRVRDVEQARQRMREHLDDVLLAWRVVKTELDKEPVGTTDTSGGANSPQIDVEASAVKAGAAATASGPTGERDD